MTKNETMPTSHSFTKSVADLVEQFGVEVDDAVDVEMNDPRSIDTLMIDLSDVESGRVMFQCGDHAHEVSPSSVIKIRTSPSSEAKSFRLKSVSDRQAIPAARGGKVSNERAAEILGASGHEMPTADELEAAKQAARPETSSRA